MQRTYKLLIHKEPEGTYTVSVPALPGCITYGESIEHAIDMAKEAIELYIEDLNQRGDEILLLAFSSFDHRQVVGFPFLRAFHSRSPFVPAA